MRQRRRGATGPGSRRRASPAPRTQRPPFSSLLSVPSATSALLAGLLAGTVAVPCAFLLSSNDIFELTKQVVHRTLLVAGILVAVAVWLWHNRTLPAGRSRAPLNDLARSPAGWVACAVTLAWAAATGTSVAPTISLWGVALRWQGLLAQLGYLATFLVAALACQDWRRARVFTAVTVAVASALAAYGLAQPAGLDPMPWASLSHRFPIATFGNQNYLGAYLVLPLFLTLGLAVGAATGNRRAAWLACAALQALVLLLTLSRGAWLGMLAGLFALGALLVYARLARPRVVLFSAAFCGLPALVLLLAVPGARQRISSMLNPAAGTAGLRLEYWRASLEHWLSRPLFGFGPDTQSAVFEWRYLRAFQEEATDRAHSALFDTLLVSGAGGLAALLLAIAVTGWALWRLLHTSRASATLEPTGAPSASQRALAAGIGAALMAHVAEQLFNLEVVSASFLAWTLAGAAVGLASIRSGASPPIGAQISRAKAAPWRLAAAIALVAGGIPAFAWWEARPLVADVAFKAATQPGLPPSVKTRYLQDALAAWDQDPELWLSLAESRASEAQSLSGPPLDAAHSEAVSAAARGVSLNPYSPRGWSREGAVLGILAEKRSDTGLAAAARAAHARATELGPQHWRNWHYLGETEFRLGAFAAAQAAFSRALTLYEGEPATWAGLGNAAARAGDPATARRAYARVVQMRPNDPEARRALASVGG